MDVLKKIGLVSLVGLKEGKGGTRKYYGSSSRLLDHDVTIKDFRSFLNLIDKIKPVLNQLIQSFLNNNKVEIMTMVNQLSPCDKCDTGHFVEFIISQAIISSLGKIFDNFSLEFYLTEQEGYFLQVEDELLSKT